jgi:hypothetical protein
MCKTLHRVQGTLTKNTIVGHIVGDNGQKCMLVARGPGIEGDGNL